MLLPKHRRNKITYLKGWKSEARDTCGNVAVCCGSMFSYQQKSVTFLREVNTQKVVNYSFKKPGAHRKTIWIFHMYS